MDSDSLIMILHTHTQFVIEFFYSILFFSYMGKAPVTSNIKEGRNSYL